AHVLEPEVGTVLDIAGGLTVVVVRVPKDRTGHGITAAGAAPTAQHGGGLVGGHRHILGIQPVGVEDVIALYPLEENVQFKVSKAEGIVQGKREFRIWVSYKGPIPVVDQPITVQILEPDVPGGRTGGGICSRDLEGMGLHFPLGLK